MLATNLRFEVELGKHDMDSMMVFAEDARGDYAASDPAMQSERCWGQDLAGEWGIETPDQSFQFLTVCMGRPVIETDADWSVGSHASLSADRCPQELPDNGLVPNRLSCLHVHRHPLAFNVCIAAGGTQLRSNAWKRELSQLVARCLPPCHFWGGSLSTPRVNPATSLWTLIPSMRHTALEVSTHPRLGCYKVGSSSSLGISHSVLQSRAAAASSGSVAQEVSVTCRGGAVSLAPQVVHSQQRRCKVGSLSSLGVSRFTCNVYTGVMSSNRANGCLCLPVQGPSLNAQSCPRRCPPGLLGSLRPPRPSAIAHLRAQALDIQPASLLSYPLSELPLAQLKILTVCDTQEGGIHRYTCLERLYHVTTRRGADDWSLTDFVADAISSNPESARGARVLLPPLDNLPEPQVVVTASAIPRTRQVVPIDLRGLGGKICCVVVRPGMDAQEVLSTLFQECGRPPEAALLAFQAQALFLQDPLGRVWEQMPPDLEGLGWLRLQIDTTRLVPDALEPGRQPGVSTTTTTGALPLVSQGSQVAFILTGCGATVRSHPQGIANVNVQENVQQLVQALAMQGTLPDRARLLLTAACPLSRRAGVTIVTLLCYPDDGDVHIVYDASTCGTLVHAMTVNPGTMPRDVMMPAQVDRGFIVTVNGVPMTAQHRPLVTGDLVQLIANPAIFTSVPSMHVTREIHRLRFLAVPMRMPRLARPATAHIPEWQAQATTALQRFYDARFLEHRALFGVPDADTTPVYIVGSQHPPLLLYIDQPLTPDLHQVQQHLDQLEILAPGTRLADPRTMASMAPMFVSVPPGALFATMLMSAPGHPLDFLVFSMPRGRELGGITLPASRGWLNIPPARAADGAVATRVRGGDPEERHPASIQRLRSQSSGPSQGGTSLVQIPDVSAKQAKRCAQFHATAAHLLPHCTCQQGQVICETKDEAPHNAAEESPPPAHLPIRLPPLSASVRAGSKPATEASSVPTPFGRRVVRLPNVAKPGGSHTACRAAAAAARLPKPHAEKSPSSTTPAVHPAACAGPSTPGPRVPSLDEWAAAWHSEPDFGVTGPAAALLQHRHAPGRWLPHAIHVYVDGSAGAGRRPGWSVVVCEALADQDAHWENVLGFFSGTTKDFDTQALAGSDHNMDSETAALAVASVWAAAWPPSVPVVVFCDCQVLVCIALGNAEPHGNSRTARLQRACRCVWQALTRRPTPAQLQWMPSHQGCPGNELADQIAKHARDRDSRSLPVAFFQLLKHPALPWLWHMLYPSPALPTLRSLERPVYEAEDPVPASCFPKAQPRPCKEMQTPLSLSLCTYNAQSMSKKKNICRTQFQQAGIHVVFLQETRYKQGGTCRAQDYLEFRSSATNGNGGCAIWIAAHLPTGKLQAQQVKILHQDPRRLLLRLKASRLDCFLFSGHAPHSGAPAQEADRWWTETDKILRRHHHGQRPLLAGIDANAQLGLVSSPAVGAHAPDHETPNGERLRAFCDAHCLALPTTFANPAGQVLSQDLEAYTWVSPSGAKYRIDFIAVPQQCLQAVESQGVWRDFETGGPEDHYPVYTRLRLRADAPDGPACSFPRLGLKRVQDVQQAGLDFAPLLAAAANTPWSANIHEHVAELDASIWQAALAVQPQRRPQKPYLDDEAWGLICERKQAKKAIKHAADAFRRTEIGLVFRTWKFARAPERYAAPHSGANKLERRRWAYYRAVAAHKALLPRLRQAVEASKANYLAGLAQEYEDAAKEGNSRALYAALQHFRPAGKKVFKPFGPAVTFLTDEGTAVQTHAEQQEIHRRHFAAQEAGELLDIDQYCAAPAAEALSQSCSLADLPTLLEVEQMIRQAKDGKAPGPSGVPGCVWKSAPSAAAEALLPIYLKAHLRLTEPVQYRGCRLVALLKKLCTTAKAENFRSIALLDASAKYYHRLHRRTLVKEIEDRDLPLLQGCVPGGGPVALTHILATALNLARLRKHSAAILFLDLRAAYYRLVREAVTGADISDQDLCRLLHRLQVSPQHVRDVAQYATAGGLLKKASPHFQRVLACTFHATYFVMDDVQAATATHAGSRPGDAISDILYGLAVADLCIDVRRQLESQGMPDAYLPTWADDISLPIEAPAATLLSAASTVATTMHNACLRRAMAPNYGAGKTELLLAWHGEGARKHATDCFRTGQASLQLATVPAEQLACVTQYKHLGTTLRTTGGIRADLRAKFAHAQAVTSPLMKPVFKRQSVPLPHRAALLDTLAMSRATYGVAIWHHFSNRDACLWEHSTAKLYRALHKPVIVDGAPHFPEASLLCYQSGRPCPEDQRKLLVLEHGRFLGTQQLERLMNMLQEEANLTDLSWQAEAQAAFTRLQTLVGRRMDRHGVRCLDDYFDHSLHRPHQVKGWLRAARLLAARQAPIEPDPQKQAPQQTCPAVPGRDVGCEVCDEQFPDLHAARAHMWAKHGRGTVLSQIAPSSRCACCLTEFWQHARLLRHLVHDKPECGHHLLANPGRWPSSSPTVRASGDDTLPKDTLPAIRAAGPLPPPRCAWVSAEQLCKLQGFFDECEPEAADVAYAAKQALSEFASANDATRDAFFEWLGLERSHIFTRVLSNAGVLY